MQTGVRTVREQALSQQASASGAAGENENPLARADKAASAFIVLSKPEITSACEHVQPKYTDSLDTKGCDNADAQDGGVVVLTDELTDQPAVVEAAEAEAAVGEEATGKSESTGKSEFWLFLFIGGFVAFGASISGSGSP